MAINPLKILKYATKLANPVALVLEDIAPAIAKKLLGDDDKEKVDALGKVVEVLLPGKDDPSEQDVWDAVNNAKPEQISRIGELDYQIRMAELAIENKIVNKDIFALETQDTQNARTMAQRVGWDFYKVLTYALLGSFLLLTLIVTYVGVARYEMSEFYQVLLNSAMNTLTNLVMSMIGFWIGREYNKQKYDGKAI